MQPAVHIISTRVSDFADAARRLPDGYGEPPKDIEPLRPSPRGQPLKNGSGINVYPVKPWHFSTIGAILPLLTEIKTLSHGRKLGRSFCVISMMICASHLACRVISLLNTVPYRFADKTFWRDSSRQIGGFMSALSVMRPSIALLLMGTSTLRSNTIYRKAVILTSPVILLTFCLYVPPATG